MSARIVLQAVEDLSEDVCREIEREYQRRLAANRAHFEREVEANLFADDDVRLMVEESLGQEIVEAWCQNRGEEMVEAWRQDRVEGMVEAWCQYRVEEIVEAMRQDAST